MHSAILHLKVESESGNANEKVKFKKENPENRKWKCPPLYIAGDGIQSVFSDASNLPVEAVANEDYEEAVDLSREMHRHLQDGDDERLWW